MESKQAEQRKKRARRSLRRRGRRVPLVAVIAAVFVIVAMGSMMNKKLDAEIREKEAQLANARFELEMQNKKRDELKSMLDLAATDEFIATEARTKYGFLAEGEIRFVITNPYVLWGPEGPPPEFQKKNE